MLHILLPMAGAGSRFIDEGYALPKPLLAVGQNPMVISAMKMLPKSDKQTFIIRKEHEINYQITDKIYHYFKDANVLSLDYLTEGQASTCLIAKDLINNNDELIITACDNGLVFDENKFNDLKTNADAIVFTFRNNPAVLVKPNAYGWVKVNNQEITHASVKKALSETPMNDHAIVGTFWFKKGAYFVEAAEKMIAENRRINNEFYVDECVNDIIDMGLKVCVFEIDQYICWGTPQDYETYLFWEKYFNKNK